MVRFYKRRQEGMTLIEVLIAMLILAIGLLGGAGLQLNALKYTRSALMNTQASFIAQDLLERMRANAGGDYRVTGLDRTSPTLSGVAGQDLNEFKRNIRQFAGDAAKGTVAVSGQQVRISLEWNDARGGQHDGFSNSFTLSSQISADAPVKAS